MKMASSGINKVILIGRLGSDPEIRNTTDGKSIAKVSIATSESWKNKESGEYEQNTEWHKVVFFGNLAGIVGEYLSKGDKVYIEGKIKTNKWNDKEGNPKSTIQIIANNMQMLGNKKDKESFVENNVEEKAADASDFQDIPF